MRALNWAAFLSVAALVVWFLTAFFKLDTYGDASGGGGTGDGPSALGSRNSAMWFGFAGGVFGLGALFTILMYRKDSKTVRWYYALLLAALRITTYGVLVFVFLLPALQTWERSERTSRVVVILDVSPSITDKSDEIGTGPGKKPKTRLSTVIDFLTDASDQKVEFLKNLLAKNPVVVYRLGTRLDDESQTIASGDTPWNASEWDAFARYDFRSFLLRGLSDEGKSAVVNNATWQPEKFGGPDWATSWVADFKLKFDIGKEDGTRDRKTPDGMTEEDGTKLHANVAKLEKRIDVAKSIAQGTNVPDSVAAAVSREASNMVQGIIVFTDGRSNLGGDAGYAELKDRATREKIPIYSVAVGEDRQTVSITITDVQAPDNAPPDEPFKIVVEADGMNLANQAVEVVLGLFLPGKDTKTDAPDHELKGTLTFLPGDPPHGQAEFVIDPSKLPAALTTDSTDAAIKKRVLKSGSWAAVARIAKDKREAFAEAEHVRERKGIQVIKNPLKVLLMGSGPSREYQAVRSLFAREVLEKRAELYVLLQNEGGAAGTIVQDVDPDRLLGKFPTKFEVVVKEEVPKDAAPKEADPKKPRIEKKIDTDNLNEYDLIIAVDPDWSELSAVQASNIQRWVQEQGGGLIYVAGPINTFQLARVEQGGRLSPLLNVLPVIPEDIIAIRIRATPRTARRLYLNPLPASELLKLDGAGEDAIGGWEQFFTDRAKYSADPDLKRELFPRRGFFAAYPVKEVKPGAKVLAEFGDFEEGVGKVVRPWIVSSNPAAAWRTVFLASGEVYRMFAFDPPTGKEFFDRFWIKMSRYAVAKRNFKAARGRVLVSKEYTTGSYIRIQARVMDPASQPYPMNGPGAIDPKFRIVRVSPGGELKLLGSFPMAVKQSGNEFDGYYQGQVQYDAANMPPGDFRYRVEIDVPDNGGTITGEYTIRKSDPEMDNTRPDAAALLRLASPADGDFPSRIKNPEAQKKLLEGLPKEQGTPKLAFKLTDTSLLALIPECMNTEKSEINNRGRADALWDRGWDVPHNWTSWAFKDPVKLSYALLLVVLLLSLEWMGRKLLRLA
ncbi:MAG TPA: hypothetical protein VMZ71_08280 [Gemmataceae bacterium]|nr:hypothetical protein [Gemmataceae bacterium]